MSNNYEEILANSNILNIIEYYGINVNRNKCICPFHNDTHPSMMINANKGIAKCFSCGAGGNSISFIQKYENEVNHRDFSFRDAMQKAIEIQNLNIKLSEDNKNELTKEQRELEIQRAILRDVITIIENNLKNDNIECKKALEYLETRKLSDKTIKKLHIGYSLSNSNSLTDKLKSKYSVNDLIKAGVTKNKDGKLVDVFNGRIMIPILDENGNPVGFGARVINNEVKPKYLNTKETELFNKSKLLFNYNNAKYLSRNHELIIVEGYMDAISGVQMNMDNIIAIMGTALTDEHIDLIKKLNCEILLSLDNDEAGKNAMIRIIPELLKENLEVSVLDISKIKGNFKDFGDIQNANISKEEVYQTKVSGFIFLLENKYLENNKLNVDIISNIYKRMKKDGVIKDTKDILRFKEYVMNKTNFKDEEVENIINPKQVEQENRVDRYKDVYFYLYIVDLIKKYAIKHQDRILQKYIEAGNPNSIDMEKSLDNVNYLKDDELTINIGSYIKEYIYNSEEYIKFKNDKAFILEKLLNNVKSFDSSGKIVNIGLTNEQKDLVLKQYAESFDSNVKEYIENNPDEFEDLFIANNTNQFEKLFPKTYVETLKEQSVDRFRNENVMEAVRYGLAYPEEMKSAMNEQFVNNEKYKTLLVFNNTNNILNLSPENIIEDKEIEKEEVVKEKENTQEQKIQKKNNNEMSIFIKLSGKEKESYKGMYLPIDTGTQIFIPKQLYKKDDNKIEILNSSTKSANMSEYLIDNDSQTKKWVSRLTLEDFYHKYFNLYEISMDKEVMPSASY